MVRRRHSLSTAVGALTLAVTLASPAAAHDQLTGTQPESGATVTSAPKDVTLTFNAGVLKVGNQISITGPDGKPELVNPTVSGNQVTAPFKPSGDGPYQVVWRVTSSDGHPISGNFKFDLKTGANPSTSPSTDATNTTGGALGQLTQGATPAPSDATVKGPTTPTRHEPGDNQPLLVIGGAIVVALAIAGAWVVARKRVKDDPS